MIGMMVDRGMIRKVNIGKKVNVNPRVATNSLGWEVQVYTELDGWRKVSGLPIVPQKGVAEMMKEELEKKDREYWDGLRSNASYRVYEALQFPIQ